MARQARSCGSRWGAGRRARDGVARVAPRVRRHGAPPRERRQAILGKNATPESLAELSAQLGLDQSAPHRYWRLAELAAAGRPRPIDPRQPVGLGHHRPPDRQLADARGRDAPDPRAARARPRGVRGRASLPGERSRAAEPHADPQRAAGVRDGHAARAHLRRDVGGAPAGLPLRPGGLRVAAPGASSSSRSRRSWPRPWRRRHGWCAGASSRSSTGRTSRWPASRACRTRRCCGVTCSRTRSCRRVQVVALSIGWMHGRDRRRRVRLPVPGHGPGARLRRVRAATSRPSRPWV